MTLFESFYGIYGERIHTLTRCRDITSFEITSVQVRYLKVKDKMWE